MAKTVSIILCCYNEEGNIPVIINALHETMRNVDYNYEIIAVDDGSSDNTLEILKKTALTDKHLFYIELSRNFGHQNALKAGLDFSRGDCIISMDADMQHPPEIIPEFIKKWEEGYEVVYTRRMEDKKLPLVKRKTSGLFYKSLNSISEIKLERGTADFRLLDRKAADIIIMLKEDDLFMRGLVKWIGFRQYAIDYMPNERASGESKYSMKKMMRLALRGLTSFSIKPLYMAIYLGLFFAIVAILFIPYVIYSIYFGHSVSGWASIILTIVFFGGVQLSVLGIIGLYIGKLFMQTKYRPVYIVRNTNIEQ